MTTANEKSKVYKFIGKAYWAKVYEPDEFRGASNWKIDLVVDEENLKKYKEAGIQGKVKSNEEGPVLAFKRPYTKLIKGVQQIFSGPKILKEDGSVLVEYKKNEEGTAFERVGNPVLIGNGSVVEVTVVVYPTTMGPGQRMESVRIIDLIEYASDEGKYQDRVIVGEVPNTDNKKKAPW